MSNDTPQYPACGPERERITFTWFAPSMVDVYPPMLSFGSGFDVEGWNDVNVQAKNTMHRMAANFILIKFRE
jgi:hypothetical protein